MNSEQVIQMENENMLATYARLPIVIKPARDVWYMIQKGNHIWILLQELL